MPIEGAPVVSLGEVRGWSREQLHREIVIQDDNIRRLEGVVDIEFKHELFMQRKYIVWIDVQKYHEGEYEVIHKLSLIILDASEKIVDNIDMRMICSGESIRRMAGGTLGEAGPIWVHQRSGGASSRWRTIPLTGDSQDLTWEDCGVKFRNYDVVITIVVVSSEEVRDRIWRNLLSKREVHRAIRGLSFGPFRPRGAASTASEVIINRGSSPSKVGDPSQSEPSIAAEPPSIIVEDKVNIETEEDTMAGADMSGSSDIRVKRILDLMKEFDAEAEHLLMETNEKNREHHQGD